MSSEEKVELLGEHYEAQPIKHGHVNKAAKARRPFRCGKCGEHYSVDYLLKHKFCQNDFGILVHV